MAGLICKVEARALPVAEPHQIPLPQLAQEALVQAPLSPGFQRDIVSAKAPAGRPAVVAAQCSEDYRA